MNYTDEQNKGNNSGMYGQTEGMRSEQENRSDSDRMKAGEQNRQDEVGYDKTRGDETAWKSGEGLSDKVERKLEKAEKKIEKAEKKVEKAGEKFAKGFVNDGERKLEKAIRKYEDKLIQAVAEEKLGELSDDNYLSTQVTQMMYPSYKADFSDSDWIDCYRVTYKNGKLNLAVTYPGDVEGWRYYYEEIIYGKQNTEELRELVDGMSEVEKRGE